MVGEPAELGSGGEEGGGEAAEQRAQPARVGRQRAPRVWVRGPQGLALAYDAPEERAVEKQQRAAGEYDERAELDGAAADGTVRIGRCWLGQLHRASVRLPAITSGEREAALGPHLTMLGTSARIDP